MNRDRRRWLERTLRAAAVCAVLPGAGRATGAPGTGVGTGGGRRLVLIELGGANDGLNTLVPWRHDVYRALRPTLSLDAGEVIELGGLGGLRGRGWHDAPALHGSLAALMPLLERGELAVVQGLGYPDPDRSHFTSIRYWESGGDGRGGAGPDGWITHDLEHRLGRARSDAHGIGLDGSVGPFDSATGRWLTTTSAASLGRLHARAPGRDALEHPNAAVAAMAARMRDVDRTLARLQDRIRRAPGVAPFDGGALGERLRDVARLIGAGLEVPAYHVRLASFDTHEGQRPRHARLLGELAASIAALRRALTATGEWERTLVMTYSEFGRRAAENGSGGTDHGTAAPHLLAGGALGAGAPLFGRAPDLDALAGDDPVATLDYRALYERVLCGWFGIDANRFAGYRDAALDGLLTRA